MHCPVPRQPGRGPAPRLPPAKHAVCRPNLQAGKTRPHQRSRSEVQKPDAGRGGGCNSSEDPQHTPRMLSGVSPMTQPPRATRRRERSSLTPNPERSPSSATSLRVSSTLRKGGGASRLLASFPGGHAINELEQILASKPPPEKGQTGNCSGAEVGTGCQGVCSHKCVLPPQACHLTQRSPPRGQAEQKINL